MLAHDELDRSEHVLRWAHELLRDGFSGSLPEVLGGLLTALNCKSAGIAAVVSHRPMQVACAGADTREMPWESDPRLVDDVRNSPTGISLHRGDTTLLATMISEPLCGEWLLWASAGVNRAWSHAERGSLALAGQALLRTLASDASPTARLIIEAARIRRQFNGAAGIAGRLSHDFSNMLTAILGFAELCQTQIPRDSLPGRFVREVWQSASDAAHWVRKLQMFCRELKSNLPPADLSTVVAQEQKRLRMTHGEDVALVANIANDLPTVGIDADALRHILEQLLQNGYDAITGDGVITVTAREMTLTSEDCLQLIGNPQPGRSIEIIISDTGHGMSDEVRSRIRHEVFFSTKGRHRGLGLPIVYGMLRNCGGGLRFAAAAPHGTVVRVFLPVAETPRPTQSPSRNGRNDRSFAHNELLLGKN